MKVATRNNLLRKLSNSKWGANASTIRTTALAVCYSVAEYASPVWARSYHAHKLNPELNSACRAVTGCMKPTNVEDLYLLAGIAPPDIRRDVCARVEKTKQETNKAHSLYGEKNTICCIFLIFFCYLTMTFLVEKIRKPQNKKVWPNRPILYIIILLYRIVVCLQIRP